ncbi:hypothetical protein M406DRAFT_78038 [Cryphonectria parasitica EP155]|uniref:tRNA (adenine(58)-N(1))-methyltransferase catalytic subunit TRM61 n=1 Tax=Cryphonectria parasitica (strain ATCC 38755 / EP155) TaxID=660469 RepID=A0A9P5CVT5_CRYP1|nr:uncharacterized protein M406DRAFT_78038 [Cryphonectria parasitica EP155]KAF3771291.1 hypothetical protein M406DRAFT_78038 [Cryphonectria parasitica EP155]
MLQKESPFLHPGSVTRANTLAIVQLAKDDLVPVYLRQSQGEHDGYKEGHVLNTRFGSFPHSTLIGIPWGSQVRASNVDTGSRGRKKKNDQQQIKKEGEDSALHSSENRNGHQVPAQKQQQKGNTTAAKSGFIHILPPTPEIWTSSLPHRTQVVYTPDYSYVLQRIRARPGTRLIEAGSGSGSFTHASARAVYDGCTGYHDEPQPTGKVFSFEFHEQRFEKMKKELQEHGLSSLVELNHRDVYNEGFLVDGKSPEADAVFLDLPAPWLALPHLSRRRPKTGNEMEGVEGRQEEWISPLNPNKSAYICTFSPCIEQVTRTVSEMRKLGWVDIEMVEISHKRVQVFREKIGLNIVSERGMQQAPKDVSEALERLKEIEVKAAEHNAKMLAQHSHKKVEDDDDDDDEEENKDTAVKPFMQGRLVTRGEAEIKAHTSYLVFAILPREWTEEDEAAAAAKWPIGNEQKVIGAVDRAARKQQKREQMHGNRQKNNKMKEDGRAKGRAKAAGGKNEDGMMTAQAEQPSKETRQAQTLDA